MKPSQIDQILEWVGALILILGTLVNSMGYYPQGPIILCVGGLFWFWVSIRWRKASLIVVNTVMTLTAVAGMVWHYWGG